MALLEPQLCEELLRSDCEKRAKIPYNFQIERPPWHTLHSHSFGHVTWKLWVGLPVPSLFHGLKLAHSSVLKRAEARLGAIRIIFHRSACPQTLVIFSERYCTVNVVKSVWSLLTELLFNRLRLKTAFEIFIYVQDTTKAEMHSDHKKVAKDWCEDYWGLIVSELCTTTLPHIVVFWQG